MVTIYSDFTAIKRLQYAANHIFCAVLGAEFTITSDKAAFLAANGPCINYSTEDLGHGIRIVPTGLLMESGISDMHNANVETWRATSWRAVDMETWHATSLPDDVFSATFYLLSLYAEYLPSELDLHGRFKAENSPLFRQGLLETPIIDRWAYALKDELERAGYKTSDFIGRTYHAVCTYDLDFPFKHLKEGFVKFVGKSLRDLSNGNYKLFWERLNTHLRKMRDPYYFAMWRIDDAHRQLKHPYILFVFSPTNPVIAGLTRNPNTNAPYLKYLSNVGEIGLHESYGAGSMGGLLVKPAMTIIKEKKRLEKLLKNRGLRVKPAMTDGSVNSERFHFLRIRIPNTYRHLNEADFKDDYSLAFANAVGFRSGTAVPHPFYDLERDEVTDLIIHPTVMMDATFMAHQKITPEDALAKIKQLIDACKQSGGDYVSLWHNSNLAGTSAENPWLKVYLESTQYAISLENV
ncbi:hypothetical protein SAMD00024442_32_25 [Candidatus Symbiothrix dinenymphae]|nr:hypothetical protein SAMD00024442_32_25 [Candidatus Symbiothrix dinenymphae]